MASRNQQAALAPERPVVRQVNLSERARARFEEAANIQRVQKPHDIRGAIPMVDYTNPAKFPPYVFKEYPKMPLLDGNKPIVIHEDGTLLIFFDAADEVDFRENNPELAEEIERNAPGLTMSAQLQKNEEELSSLRKMLRDAGIDPDAGKPKPRNPLSAAVRGDSPTSSGGVDENDGENSEEQDGDVESDMVEASTDTKLAKTVATKPKTNGLPATLKPGGNKGK